MNFSDILDAIVEIIELSTPDDKNEPRSTSEDNLFSTDSNRSFFNLFLLSIKFTFYANCLIFSILNLFKIHFQKNVCLNRFQHNDHVYLKILSYIDNGLGIIKTHQEFYR